ncbi:hypothetical protein K435DRAFT_769060 [Dendrothele bispora CBS 962.96]|uniref:G-protein coupled receptors family 1 profile domain-containing protein n=1 Tax=Dendrothele bispora (strain CBS 962.96) TaxID=1314807 RepID=A0A4S8KSS6_DENBC|nr:hypothetical protein K435DRAFT_769060 [Dendrothele bispora CBS 962.96]
MYIWDICSNLGDEYRLLLKATSRPLPTVVYFVARLSCLGFVISYALSFTAQTQNCQTLMLTSTSLSAIALSTVTLLFFLRLRAIYEDNRPVVGIFFILWLGNVACVSMIPLIFKAATPSNIQGINYCIAESIRIRNASIPAIGALVHDTCVFIAISYRLLKNSTVNNFQGATFETVTKTFILGKNLPKFSKVLFRGGQLLYLITLMASISTVILLHIPSIPTTYRVVADPPQVAILSSLACTVFRNLRLGKMFDGQTQHKKAIVEFQWASNSSHPSQAIPLSMANTSKDGNNNK